MESLMARPYLQPHYGNGVFSNVYLSAGQHLPAPHCRNESCRYVQAWSASAGKALNVVKLV